VFVLGVTDGLMPDYRSLQGRQLEEERRLLYVAVTRARRTLQLYHAPHRLTSGEDAESRSRFLKKAIKAGLLRVTENSQ
jgi:DNA helicase-2/ATP-dependent DNA helicase PcrA